MEQLVHEVIGNTDLLGIILSFLPYQEKFKLRLVCQQWNFLLHKPAIFYGFDKPLIDLENIINGTKHRWVEEVYNEDSAEIQSFPGLTEISQGLLPQCILFFTYFTGFQSLTSKNFMLHIPQELSLPEHNKALTERRIEQRKLRENISKPNIVDYFSGFTYVTHKGVRLHDLKNITARIPYNLSNEVNNCTKSNLVNNSQNLASVHLLRNPRISQLQQQKSQNSSVPKKRHFPQHLNLFRLNLDHGRLHICPYTGEYFNPVPFQLFEESVVRLLPLLSKAQIEQLAIFYFLVDHRDCMYSHGTVRTVTPVIVSHQQVTNLYYAFMKSPQYVVPEKEVVLSSPFCKVGQKEFSTMFYLFWDVGPGYWTSGGVLNVFFKLEFTLQNAVLTLTCTDIMSLFKRPRYLS